VQNDVVLRARITEGEIPVLGSSVWVTARSDFDTLTWDFPLLDDGAGADSLADDGIYSGAFTNVTLPGLYGFNCRATGTAPISGDFTRYSALQTFITGVQRGDMDRNGFLDATDLQSLIDYIFFGSPPPYPSFIADVTCDGFSDALDLQVLIDILFFGASEVFCP